VKRGAGAILALLCASAAKAEDASQTFRDFELAEVPPHPGSCPFCGVPTKVPHETQEGCIAALHQEIGRMRDILANSKPTDSDARGAGNAGEAVPPNRID
jgi:hypothetical protein